MDKIKRLQMRNEQLTSEEKIRAKYEGYELSDDVALKKGLQKYNFNKCLFFIGVIFLIIGFTAMSIQLENCCYENNNLDLSSNIDFCKYEASAQYQDVVLTSLAVPVYNPNGEVLGYEVEGDYYSKGYSFLK